MKVGAWLEPDDWRTIQALVQQSLDSGAFTLAGDFGCDEEDAKDIEESAERFLSELEQRLWNRR